jgi:hypothetical protein
MNGVRTEANAKNMLYNDLIQYLRRSGEGEAKGGFLQQDVPWASDLVDALCNTLWYLEPHRSTMKGDLCFSNGSMLSFSFVVHDSFYVIVSAILSIAEAAAVFSFETTGSSYS